jgi:acetylornithine deacetylase
MKHVWEHRSGDDELDPIDLLSALVRIDSVNPDLVPGAAGEGDIATCCEQWLTAQGFATHRLEARAGRPSVVGVARGSGGGRSLMVNGHIDTVTLAGYDGDPLSARQDQERLFGRGAYDMKGGVAAMMVAAAQAKERGLRGDVLVACVADEEYASTGTAEVLEHFTADAGIVTEPSGFELTLAHKGFVWFDVIIEGRAAHGSRPDLGIDAITKAGYFLVEVDRWGEQLAAGDAHPRLGTGSVHASLIRGGEEASSYPAACRITIERRTVPGETAETVAAELSGILTRLGATVPDFVWRIERGLERDAFQADPAHPIVRTLTRHVTAALGHAPVIRAEPFWTDCALLKAAGIECVMFGADGDGAHAATEWADIASVRTLTRILTGTIVDFCG